MKRILLSMGLVVPLIFSLGGCHPSGNKTDIARSGSVTVSGVADIGGPFELVNQDGDAVSEKTLLGRPSLIYFGFTYCPDVCPTALQGLSTALASIDPDGAYYQSVFFSVDPERDTPEALKQYVSAPGFPPNLQGFTGTVEQVEAAKKAYKVYAQKVADEGSDDYLVDHASLIYFFDKDGGFVDVFTHGTSIAEMGVRLKDYKRANPL